MDAYEIIEKIRTAEKKTPVRVTLTVKAPCTFSGVEDLNLSTGRGISHISCRQKASKTVRAEHKFSQ